MHLNHYFFSRLVAELKPLIVGSFLSEIYSQQKDEVILGFAKPGIDYFIKCQLGPGIQGFTFAQEFNRAKRNSIDLFKNAADLKVTDIFVTIQDRSWGIILENNSVMFFKMHGSKSNIILYHNDVGIDQYYKTSEDISVHYTSYQKVDAFSIPNLVNNNFRIQELLPALGQEPISWLERNEYQSVSEDEKIELVCKMLDILHHPEQVYILNEHDKAILSFFENFKVLKTSETAIEAANLFQKHYYTFTLRNKFLASESKLLTAKKLKLERYIASTTQRLTELRETNISEQTADILMANLHQIAAKSETVILFDFYQNKEREIKLKKDLSPQRNAENYYRKGKNLVLDLKNLEHIIGLKQKELDSVNFALENIESRTENKKDVLSKPVVQESSPFKKFEFDGYEIRVGKSSQKNDELLQHHSHKNDLWLHARGYAGSHVLIKNITGEVVPNPVIEKAASLAAYYSKGKTNNLCPVIVTERKFVRKAKGMAPGQVIVEKEKTVMVTPSEF